MIEFSVSAINNYIKNILSSDINLKSVSLEGEVCPFKEPSKNGHLYFELKDEDARIRCVFFNITSKYTELPFKEGDNVVLDGRIDVYEKSGQYQFIASNVKVEGLGDLYIKFLELKQSLEKEGLFELTKRQMSLYPKKIGLITSPTGAAIRDFTSVIKRRFPIASVFLYPVHVQGIETVNEVCRAIDCFNNLDMDIVVLTRGGGSYDELAVFNNEKIARKLAESIHPTVSAIGHEPDFLITDFVADLRAATPTAAAEVITPNLRDIIYSINDKIESNLNNIFKSIENERIVLNNYNRILNLKSPINQIHDGIEKINYLKSKLDQSFKLKLFAEKNSLNKLDSRLLPYNVNDILNRGYSITVDQNGDLISNAKSFNKGDKIKTIFNKGSIISEII